MKPVHAFLGAAVTLSAIAGCSTTTTIYDPATTRLEIRQEGNVSSEEFRDVAIAAVNSALTNVKFKNFMKKYKTEMGDIDAIPVLKLDKVINDTDDPDLNVDEMTDLLNEALLNAGVVDVTLAEGQGRTATIAASRDLEYDENFDQSTVAPKGTLQAARLLLRPKVISSLVSDGSRRATTRTFVLEMVDIRTGLLMWKYTKQLGFLREKGTFGW